MASGTIDFTQSQSSGSYIDGKIVWESVANASVNTSNVTVSIYVRKGSTTTTLTIPTEGTWIYTCTVNGKSISGTVSKSVLTNWVLLTTYSFADITHDTDGSKSIPISGKIVAPTMTSFNGHSTSGAATVSLDTISRPTTLDSLVLTGGNLDGTINVNYTTKSSQFYNKYIVYVNVNKLLTQIRTDTLSPLKTGQNTYPLKFDEYELPRIYSKVSNSSFATIRVTIQTYLDNTCTTKIGSDQSREITVALPTGVVPEAVLTIGPVNSGWIGSVRDNGEEIYVAGLSGATVILAASPGEGAQPDTASITYDGTTVNTTFNTTLNVKTLNKAGEIKFKAKVVDSRGRTATDEKTITVRPYSSPTVTSMNVERGIYNNGWTPNATGGDVKVKFQTTLSLKNEGNVYTAAFKIDNKEPTLLVGGTTSGLESKAEQTFYLVGVDGEKSHTLKLTVTDKVGNVGAATITIPTKHITVEYRYTGKGIAFGKTSEKDAFECAMDAEFTGDVNIKGAIKGDTTFDDNINIKRNINMGGLNGQAYEQVIRFSNPTSSTYPHNAYFYGGNPNSVNTIGCYDGQNNRLVWGYNDTTNTITIGNSGANISINGTTMADFIVEQGVSGIWIYRKWNSGIAECWGVSNAITQTTSTDWNVMTSNTSTPAVSYPFEFKNSPVVSPSVHIHDANFWLVTMTAGSTTATPTYQIARGKSATTVTFKLGYYVFGQWK